MFFGVEDLKTDEIFLKLTKTWLGLFDYYL